ncbi:MAG: serine/threonine protein phosphatase [Blastopirellula sp.]|nr:MAG: serine/threonine protein phosphatase [Blastopirellula sp.]
MIIVSRHLAIGDIHGCIDSLVSLVDYVAIRPEDTIVTLGDYIDRGPDTCAVLDYLIHLDKTHKLVSLRGNHEIMLLDAREKKSCFRDWMGCGGEATLRSYSPFEGDAGKFTDVPDSHFDFLENKLVSYYECETHFFVHANADADIAFADQPAFLLYWQDFRDPPRHCSGKTMVCGHTSQKSGLPLFNENAICIDTCAYGVGWLTCLDIDSSTIWQTNEVGERRTFHLSEIENVI